MEEGSDAKEDGEGNGSGEGRVVVVVGIASLRGNIAILSGCDIDTRRGGRWGRGGSGSGHDIQA